eukprot:Blabericola_migrator_1__3556@NODE_2055_length_3352_cov_62_771994_g1303_i0_p2_GENE_NODE_2055_length_3352_cov_62_771994_g1303_i0NODE_2055_length_3352_cov_62_771994_g1303_i0_p2_ORF_typecomplete_len314_score31_69UPF0167/PF03691_14/0_34_NODE_2055_length_3352_cov_62_771994_g1303_i019432884
MRTPLDTSLDPFTFPLLSLLDSQYGKRLFFVRSPRRGDESNSRRPSLPQILGHLSVIQGTSKTPRWIFWEISMSAASIGDDFKDDLHSQIITLRLPPMGLCPLSCVQSFASSLLWWLSIDSTNLAVIVYDEMRPELLFVLAAALLLIESDASSGARTRPSSASAILEQLEKRDATGGSDFHWFAKFLGLKGTLGFVPFQNWPASCQRYTRYIEHLNSMQFEYANEVANDKKVANGEKSSRFNLFHRAYRVRRLTLEGDGLFQKPPSIEIYHRLPAPLEDGKITDFDSFRDSKWSLISDAAATGKSFKLSYGDE